MLHLLITILLLATFLPLPAWGQTPAGTWRPGQGHSPEGQPLRSTFEGTTGNKLIDVDDLDGAFIKSATAAGLLTVQLSDNTEATVQLNLGSTDTTLTTEQVQDIVGGMVSGNTEGGITVVYDDAGDGTGKLDFTVTSMQGAGTTNLGIANRDADSLQVTSDTGTDAEIPSATTSLAGLQSAADKTRLDAAAPRASPALTGDPTAPTASAGDDDTSIATTAFVQVPVATLNGLITALTARVDALESGMEPVQTHTSYIGLSADTTFTAGEATGGNSFTGNVGTIPDIPSGQTRYVGFFVPDSAFDTGETITAVYRYAVGNRNTLNIINGHTVESDTIEVAGEAHRLVRTTTAVNTLVNGLEMEVVIGVP